ncbi:hypothetical protein [Streptomyces erythrochromogenes]|uniref:hypothetical protein n=1 Tax=Streptomyces erythrochromogenes TaxID=285574 RepID=UPI0037D0816C
MTKVALRPYALLPRQYDERQVLASTVDAWGRALWLVCTDARFPSGPRGGRLAQPLTLPFDALLVIRDGDSVRERTLHDVAVCPNHIEALPKGGVVLHGVRGADRRNGQLFGRDGRPRRRFAMGSHVIQLVADRRAGLWTCHGEEGMYGDDPLSADALARWDGAGNRLHGFRPSARARFLLEVDALNVTDSEVLAADHLDRALVEQRTGGPPRIRSLPMRGIHGLAVRDGRLLVLGGPGGVGRLHHCRLTDDGVVITGQGELVWPNGDPVRRYSRPVGRGPHLYLRNPRSMRMWYELSVPD